MVKHFLSSVAGRRAEPGCARRLLLNEYYVVVAAKDAVPDAATRSVQQPGRADGACQNERDHDLLHH
jgi:hypothetical protein